MAKKCQDMNNAQHILQTKVRKGHSDVYIQLLFFPAMSATRDCPR